MRTRPPAPARPRPRSLAQVPAPGPSVLLKVIEFCLRWVHMVRHGLMSRLDGALRHTIISKTPLTPEWTMQETRKKKNKKIRSWRVGQDDAYTCFSEFSSWVTPRKCIRIECIIQHSLDPVFARCKQIADSSLHWLHALSKLRKDSRVQILSSLVRSVFADTLMSLAFAVHQQGF